MRKILMPASGHQDDHLDSVHFQLADGRIVCGRAYSQNLHSESDRAVTCECCRKAVRQQR